MVWDIGLTLVSSQRLGSLRNRLLWSYLAVIAAILGTFSVAVYGLVARDRYQQLDQHVRQLAIAAAGTLEIIQHEYQELKTDTKYSGYLADSNVDSEMPPITLLQLMGKYKTDRVSKVLTKTLTPANQGLEWFDADGSLMVREGRLFPVAPLPLIQEARGIWIQEGKIRSFVLPVYTGIASDQLVLIGYVRASESTTNLEAELHRLLGGLAIGVAIIAGIVTLGGFWLVQQALKPILAALNQLKQFTADASHELRNPLTAIRASIAVMQSHPERIHPADVDKLQAIASASAQMSQLVEDLLLLARLDRQVPDRQVYQVVDLEELLEGLVLLYRDRAAEKNIDLTLTIEANANIEGDAVQLQRLFANLIANAVQYTPPQGTVTVTLSRNTTQAIVKVQDTGIGISSDQLPHVFDRFWRADQARSYHNSGTGLGLAIARGIVQSHRGTISVQSSLDQGSTFTVQLPLGSRQ